MKKCFGVAMIFVGTLIGAGFASGQEIFSYFSPHKSKGFFGIMLMVTLLSAVSCLIVKYCFSHGIESFSEFTQKVYKKQSFLVNSISSLYMFCSYFVMAAGCGAIFNEYFGINKLFGIILMLASSCFVISKGIGGIAKLNGVITPIILAGSLIIGVTSIIYEVSPAVSVYGFVRSVYKSQEISTLIYIGYNLIGLYAILCSFKNYAQNCKTAVSGVAMGCFVIFLVSAVMWLSLHFNYVEVLPFEIPYLYIAKKHGLGFLYTAVLLGAMITTAVSSGYGFVNFLSQKHRISPKKCALVMTVVAFPFACFKFSALVSELYYAFGICGLIFMIIFTFKYIKSEKTGENKRKINKFEK